MDYTNNVVQGRVTIHDEEALSIENPIVKIHRDYLSLSKPFFWQHQKETSATGTGSRFNIRALGADVIARAIKEKEAIVIEGENLGRMEDAHGYVAVDSGAYQYPIGQIRIKGEQEDGQYLFAISGTFLEPIPFARPREKDAFAKKFDIEFRVSARQIQLLAAGTDAEKTISEIVDPQYALKKVLVIGGYGNFGSFISRSLSKHKNIHVIVAGRSQEKAQQLAYEIGGTSWKIDIEDKFHYKIKIIRPDIVIHTSGPFQSQGYDVAKACIDYGCHYIDLADGREFVKGISSLDKDAKEKGLLVVSGASSVPCLTSALLDHYELAFKSLESVDYGITTAQKTARGLATTAAILGYTGKPFPTLIDGEMSDVYGWQNIHFRKYKSLGWRLLGNCDVPDLALFPKRYKNLKTLRFYAGLEIPFIHFTLWLLSWLVRLGLMKRLDKFAPLMLKLSYMFDWLGSANSAFHMTMSGKGSDDQPKEVTFEITARSGDGPYIPCMPSILLAQKLVSGEITQTGALPCMGLITKDEYLNALGDMDIEWEEIE